ncbi:MAG: 3-mercaptopyruvate sulfurtransferase [Pseudomonadota bacterium]
MATEKTDLTPSPIVSVEQLQARMKAGPVRLIDASWHLPTAGRDGYAEYQEARLPGAVFFDIDKASDPEASLPHMAPSAALFAAYVGGLGIAADDDVVIYDAVGVFSAPRVWWTFRLFGHERVAILNGGLPAWRAAGGTVESGPPPSPAPVSYEPAGETKIIANADDVAAAAASGGLVLDARPAARFRGEAPEPRPGLRSGHIPGSVSLPFTELLAEGLLRPEPELRARFEAAGAPIDAPGPILTSCGSGVSAAVLTIALNALGRRDVQIYDGSWAEWGGDLQRPVATAADENDPGAP